MVEVVLAEGGLWPGMAVKLGLVPCGVEWGNRCVGPAAECGWGWLRVEVSWGGGCAVCPGWGKEMSVVCMVVPEG